MGSSFGTEANFCLAFELYQVRSRHSLCIYYEQACKSVGRLPKSGEHRLARSPRCQQLNCREQRQDGEPTRRSRNGNPDRTQVSSHQLLVRSPLTSRPKPTGMYRCPAILLQSLNQHILTREVLQIAAFAHSDLCVQSWKATLRKTSRVFVLW